MKDPDRPTPTFDPTPVDQLRTVLTSAEEYAVTLEAHIKGLQQELANQRMFIQVQKDLIKRAEDNP